MAAFFAALFTCAWAAERGGRHRIGALPANGGYCFWRVTRISPTVSVPEDLELLAITEMRSPGLTATASLVSEHTAEAGLVSAPMAQVRVVAVGAVRVAVVKVGLVVSATVPVAAALVMLLPQLVGMALSAKAMVVAVTEATVKEPSNKAPDKAVQLVPAL